VKTTEKSSPGWITSHTTAMIPTLTTRLIPYMMRPNRELSFMPNFYPVGLASEHLSPAIGGPHVFSVRDLGAQLLLPGVPIGDGQPLSCSR
jgi:hypothetical protein